MAPLKPGAGEPCTVEPWVKPESLAKYLVSKSAHELRTTELRSDQIRYISGCQSSHAWNVMIFCWGRGHQTLLNWIWFIQVPVLVSQDGSEYEQYIHKKICTSKLMHNLLPHLVPSKKERRRRKKKTAIWLAQTCAHTFFCIVINKSREEKIITM